MTEKRFTMKGSTILEYEEEITAWDCCDLLNELHEENEDLATKKEDAEYELLHLKEKYEELLEENVTIKQLIHTMLRQINAENIVDEHAVYSARIVFTKKEWKLMNEIWEKI